MTSDEILLTGQAARLAGVSVITIERWIDSGRLPAARTAGGYRLIRRVDLERFLRDRERAARQRAASTRDTGETNQGR